METAVRPVQNNGRGVRRRWNAEQKPAVLQEWKNGVPLEEVCRKYAVNAAQMYRWIRSLDQGFKEPGEMVPKSLVLGLQKWVEELERAMGLIPCHTPRRSPESNGLAEAFFGSFKRDYVYQACLETLAAVECQLPAWIEHYNQHAPHSALGMQAPAEFYAEWRVKNKTQPVPN